MAEIPASLQRSAAKLAARLLAGALAVWLAAGRGVAGAEQPRLAVSSKSGRQIALLHAETSRQRIAWMPDGRLEVFDLAEAAPSDEPFVPFTAEQIAQQLTGPGGPLEGFQSRSTKRYVFIYNTSAEFQLTASRILETMFPGIVTHARVQKIPVQPPPTPMIVVMFRTQQQFRAFAKIPADFAAYYDVISNRVVMCEQSPLQGVRPDLALQQVISTVAHEGAHQILANIGVQQRLSRWPMWLSEGLAEYYAPTTFASRLKWKGAGQINDLRMFELEQFIKGGAEPGRLVGDTVVAGRLTSTGYASAWALTHFLAKNRREAFNRFVRETSQLRPLQGAEAVGAIVPSQKTDFARSFGDDLVALETQLIRHLQKQPYRDPFAAYPHYVAMAVDARGKRQATVYHASAAAEAWCRRQQAGGNAQQTQVRRFNNRLLAEAFVRQWLR